MVDPTDELERALVAVVASCRCELVDVESAGGVLRVTVERDGGLDLDDLAGVSRAISALFDGRADLTPAGRYELEVSSPGVERRLRRQAHFAKAIGSRVAIRTVAGTPGARRFEGALRAVDEDSIAVVDDEGAEHRISYAAIDRAHTVFDWRAALAGRRVSDDSAMTTRSEAS
ncbi:MAG: ribosome maturation factor RimP [Acidimicrobiales bacterium]